jgi:hypothetical protein
VRHRSSIHEEYIAEWWCGRRYQSRRNSWMHGDGIHTEHLWCLLLRVRVLLLLRCKDWELRRCRRAAQSQVGLLNDIIIGCRGHNLLLLLLLPIRIIRTRVHYRCCQDFWLLNAFQ